MNPGDSNGEFPAANPKLHLHEPCDDLCGIDVKLVLTRERERGPKETQRTPKQVENLDYCPTWDSKWDR